MSDLSSLTEISKYERFLYELSKDSILPALVIGLASAGFMIYSERKELEKN